MKRLVVGTALVLAHAHAGVPGLDGCQPKKKSDDLFAGMPRAPRMVEIEPLRGLMVPAAEQINTRANWPLRDAVIARRCPTPASFLAELMTNPALDADYLEYRVDDPFSDGHEALASRGEACHGAGDRLTCLANLGRMRQPPAGRTSESPDRPSYDEVLGYFVYSRVDEVGAISGLDVPGFFAPIDNATKAGVAFTFESPNAFGDADPSCASNAWKKDPKGWRAKDYLVAKDGTVTNLNPKKKK